MKYWLSKLNNWSIAKKLSAAILVTAFVPIFAVAYYNFRIGLLAIEKSELANLEQLAESKASQLAQLISDYKNLVSYLSDQSTFQKIVAMPQEQDFINETLRKFSTFIGAYPDVEFLMICDAQGTVLLSSNPALQGVNSNFREYFKQAMQGRTVATNILVGTTTGIPGMYYASPILSPSGLVKGVFVLKLKVNPIAKILEKGAQQGQQFFIADHEGILLYHSDEKLLYHSLRPLSASTQQRLIEDKSFGSKRIESLNLQELATAVIGGRQSGSLHYTQSQQAIIAGYAPLDNHPWVVGISQAAETYAEPLNDLYLGILRRLLMGCVIVIGLTWLFARALVRPIKILTDCASAVEKGRYDEALAPIESNDEIGQLARTFNSMLVGIRDREKIKDVFGRMVSPEVREKLVNDSLVLGGETMRVSLLFCDIRNFSTVSEKMHPQDVVSFLNEYFAEMSRAVLNWGGYINNFIGDAIVVVFGAPVAQNDIEWRAVAAALEMRDRLRALNLRRSAQGKPSIHHGIGISTGDVVAGQIGSAERFSYMVIGDTVNVAARLEALTKAIIDFPILINQATYDAVSQKSEIDITALGAHVLKGREEAVQVYGVSPATSQRADDAIARAKSIQTRQQPRRPYQ